MTEYITPDYYENDYRGAMPPDPADLSRYIKRASDTVDQVTGFKMYKEDFSTLPIVMQDLVKKATAAQVEFYVVQGGDADINAGTDNLQSVTVGSFSYSGSGSGGAEGNRDIQRVSPCALSFLAPTGLLYQGVHVHGG
ncbi:hypothetical protein [Salinithrix halophila]|uniref:Uncharacterized protein n=1 Tax=Salinithrix halophila TaxID=1485204 RepID=A0ABV8JA78_9BACL